MVSRLASTTNVEKVVYPPMTPTVAKARRWRRFGHRVTRSGRTTPSAKQPVMLTRRIAHGNSPAPVPTIRVSA
jgi:hypothetical protein